MVAFLEGIRFDLMAYLLGIILAVSKFDLSVIWVGAVNSFAYMERGGCLCILHMRGFCFNIISPSSLKKRDRIVQNV